MDLAPGQTENTVGKLDEEGGYVLRCASVTETENGITLTASKSKDMKAFVLVFVKLPETAADVITVSAAPVTGKEYEYDTAQAKFYNVTQASAVAAVQDYGIPFLTWQTGAVSASAQFPCCE
ncbi:MAG: hypothetical protein PHR56_05535 [Dehalococcoidales bacterium]|nr:hypothetical protein [Dehalococcoidales bacterium]